MNLNPVYCINTKDDFGLTALIESSQFMKNEYEKNQGDIVENQNTGRVPRTHLRIFCGYTCWDYYCLLQSPVCGRHHEL